jgi:hypothetical protein
LVSSPEPIQLGGFIFDILDGCPGCVQLFLGGIPLGLNRLIHGGKKPSRFLVFGFCRGVSGRLKACGFIKSRLGRGEFVFCRYVRFYRKSSVPRLFRQRFS